MVRHADKYLMPRKKEWDVREEKLDGKVCAFWVGKYLGYWGRRMKADTVICDCVNINYCQEVRRAWKSHGIKVYPRSAYGRTIEGGYPPYSHDFSILDGQLFGPFQSEITNMMIKKFGDGDHIDRSLSGARKRKIFLYDIKMTRAF